MDGHRFDRLTKAIAAGSSRRSVLKGLLGLSGAVLSGSLSSPADARTIGSRPTIPPPPPPPSTTPPPPTTTTPDPCGGSLRCSSGECCPGGACTAQGRCCAAGRSVCGYECCASSNQCCDGECCADGHICIGEERCCPASAFCGGVCCTGPGQRCCGDVCLEPNQCCPGVDTCPDLPATCQTGSCDQSTFICTHLAPCAGSPESPCCENGACVGLGTAANCLSCDDTCDPGEICSTAGCVTTTTTPAPTTTTTSAPTTTTNGPPTTTTSGPTTTTTTSGPTTTTTTGGPTTTTTGAPPPCSTDGDCGFGERCCAQVCRTGNCCDANTCLQSFGAVCSGEDLDGNPINLCQCSANNQCGTIACNAAGAACAADAQCCDGLECTGTLPDNAFCTQSCPEGCPDSEICCDGTCKECCGTDASNCGDSRCGIYSCVEGTCELSATVICLPNFLDRGCFTLKCDPATGSCVNDEYFGDGTSCGLITQGNGKICCAGACIEVTDTNCGGCGTVCTGGFICEGGRCACNQDTDCPGGHHCCNGDCLPTSADLQNCGGCGERCLAGLICQDGRCQCNDHADCPGDLSNLCRAGFCDVNGDCQITDTLCATTDPCRVSLGCNPTTGHCEFGPKCTGGLSCVRGQCLDCDCVIDGACYQSGDERPNNKCDHCDPNLSATQWSSKTYCPASTIDCIVRFCDPSDGMCYERVADNGATCLTPHYYDDWQCANLNSETGVCKNQKCYYPDLVNQFCNADPFDFCQFGPGTCQNGSCKASPQNENAACNFGTCSSGRCNDGDCVTFPINEGQTCTLGNPPPCRNNVGLCSFGECITFPLPDGTICAENVPNGCQGRLCQQGNCTTTFVNIREDQLCVRGITECKYAFCNEGTCGQTNDNSFCEPQDFCEDQTGVCNGDGTCSHSRPPSFGHKNCSSDAQCCPTEICICDPFITTFCLGMECWLPDDIPARPF